MAKKINVLDIIKFLGLMKQIIGPAVELVEMLKEAFKSKEKKFIEIALSAFGEGNAAETAQDVIAAAIRKLQIGLPCLEAELTSTALIDCFIEHLNKKIKSKKARNVIYLELARELSKSAAPNTEKYNSLDNDRWETLIEYVYSKKKNGGAFKFLVNG